MLAEIFIGYPGNIVDLISFSAPLYALVAAVFLLFFFRTLGLLKRKNRIRQTVVLGYYIYIPLVFCLSAFAWTVGVSAESFIVQNLTDLRPNLTEVSLHNATQAWSHLQEDYEGEAIVDAKEFRERAINELLEEFMYGDGREELKASQGYFVFQPVLSHSFAGFQAQLLQRLDDLIASAVAVSDNSSVNTIGGGDRSDAESKAGSSPGSVASIPPGSGVKSAADRYIGVKGHDGVKSYDGQVEFSLLKNVWEGSFTELLKDGLIPDAIIGQFRLEFTRVFKKIQLFFLLLTVPVLVEIGYSLYQRPKLPDA